MFVCIFEFIGSPCPLYKYDILEKNNPSCLLHNKLYMKAIFIFSFYFGIFEINYIICKIVVNFNFFSKNKIAQKKIQSFGRFKNILFLTRKFQNPLIIVQTCVEVPLHYINQKHWNNFENIKHQLNHPMNML
jgi:hypothetical protein